MLNAMICYVDYFVVTLLILERRTRRLPAVDQSSSLSSQAWSAPPSSRASSLSPESESVHSSGVMSSGTRDEDPSVPTRRNVMLDDDDAVDDDEASDDEEALEEVLSLRTRVAMAVRGAVRRLRRGETTRLSWRFICRRMFLSATRCAVASARWRCWSWRSRRRVEHGSGSAAAYGGGADFSL